MSKFIEVTAETKVLINTDEIACKIWQIPRTKWSVCLVHHTKLKSSSRVIWI